MRIMKVLILAVAALVISAVAIQACVSGEYREYAFTTVAEGRRELNASHLPDWIPAEASGLQYAWYMDAGESVCAFDLPGPAQESLVSGRDTIAPADVWLPHTPWLHQRPWWPHEQLGSMTGSGEWPVYEIADEAFETQHQFCIAQDRVFTWNVPDYAVPAGE